MKKEKVWYKKVGNWIFIVCAFILVSIFAINVYIMVQSKVNKDEVPSILGYKPFIVLSGSMETEIHKGDLILTKVVDPVTLKVGDIIAFRDAAETITTHRIIDIVEKDGETYFITKGDNNSSQDQNLVEFDDVEGILAGRIPSLGSLMDSLSNPTTIIIVLLFITVVFIIGFMISTKKQQLLNNKEFLEYKKMKEQQEKENKKATLKDKEDN